MVDGAGGIVKSLVMQFIGKAIYFFFLLYN